MEKYNDLIVSLVKKHNKYDEYELIANDIVNYVQEKAATILSTVKDESVLETYLSKLISTAMITVPKNLGFKRKQTVHKRVVFNNTNEIQERINEEPEHNIINEINEESEYLKNSNENVEQSSEPNNIEVIITEDSDIDTEELLTAENSSVEVDKTLIDKMINGVSANGDEHSLEIDNLSTFEVENIEGSEEEEEEETAEDTNNTVVLEYDEITNTLDEEFSETRNFIEEESSQNILDDNIINVNDDSETIVDEMIEEDNVSIECNEDEFVIENENDENTLNSSETSVEIDDIETTNLIINDTEEDEETQNLNLESVLPENEVEELNFDEDTDIVLDNTEDSIEEQSEDMTVNENIEIETELIDNELNSSFDGTIDDIQVDNQASISELSDNIDCLLEDDPLVVDLFEESDSLPVENLDEIEYVESSEFNLEEPVLLDEVEPLENITSEDINEVNEDFNLPDYKIFSYQPEQQQCIDADEFLSDIKHLNAKYPEKRITEICKLKYNENKTIKEISELLSMSDDDVINSLNEIIYVVKD